MLIASFPFNDHFLDTNILVGAWLKWDTQHIGAEKYINYTGYKKHISKRVCNEARGVCETYRRLINKYLNAFHEKREDISKDIMHVDKKIEKFNTDFLKGLEDYGDKTKVQSFLSEYNEKIRSLIFGTETDFDNIQEEVINIVKFAVNMLDTECRSDLAASIYKHEKCPPTYDCFYPNEKSKLKDKIGHEKDILIILDAYHIKETHVKSDICLITNDYEHMLSKKTDIEGILVGIHIESPNPSHEENPTSTTPSIDTLH